MQERNLNAVYVPLRLVYGLVPIAAGLDKFTNLLVDWKTYLPGFVARMSPVDAGVLMRGVGVIEIVAGVLVLGVLTRLGSAVVGVWLVLVGVMAALSGHADVMVRDVVMAVGAYVLCVVAMWRGEGWFAGSGVGTGARAHAVGR